MKGFLPLATVIILTAAVLVLSGSESTSGGQQEKLETKRVMVLYSFYEDAPWDRLLDEGLRTTIASDATFPVEVINERTNLVTYSDDAYQHELAKLYRHKYSKRALDLVIGLGDESVDFLLNYGDELFPQVPMLFVTSERISPQRSFSGPSRTAMAWGVDFKANVDLIAELLPQTRQIFIVAGNGMTDGNFMTLARTSLQGYTKRFAINYLTDYKMEDLLDRVSQLPEHSAILYLAIFQDAEGEKFIPSEVVSVICKRANAPVFGIYSTIVGKGIVGGSIVAAETVGKKCAELALRILQGESTVDLVSEGIPKQVRFDWRQLKRWGISEDKLPPGSEILYRVPSIWEEHREKVIGAIALITFQTVLIFGLFINLRRRRSAEKSLVESEARLSLAAESAEAGIWSLEVDNNRVWATSKARELFGLPKHSPLHYDDFLGRVHPEDRERLNGVIQKSLQSGKDAIAEFRVQRADGSLRWLASHGRPQPAGPGYPMGLMGVTVDMTDRKLAEEVMRQNQQDLSQLAGRIISAQEEELQRLSRELHDDLTQRLAALALDAALIEKQLSPSQSRTVEELKGLRNNLSDVAEEVHDLSRRLHPSILDDLGLVQAVQAESAAFTNKTGIDLSFTTQGLPDSLAPQPSLCLYRVIQESLQNIAKHSSAKASSITLQGLFNGIRLLIEDNGVGFDPEEVRKKAGIGLSSMRERVRLLDGEISFASKPGQGTQIEVFIPTKEAP